MKTKHTLAIVIMLATALQVAAQKPVTIKMPVNFYSLQAAENKPYAMILTRPKDGEEYVNTGLMQIYSTETGQPLWMQPIDFTQDKAEITDYGVVMTQGADYILSRTSAVLYDLATGNELRKIKMIPAMVDSKTDRIIGYKGSSSNKAICQRLSTGEKIWEANIKQNTESQWNEGVRISNDSILFLGRNIYSLDLATGANREYKLSTSNLNFWKFLFPNSGFYIGFAIPIGGGNILFVQYAQTFSPYRNRLNSNILHDKKVVFVADKEHLACLDKELKPLWSYKFKERNSRGSFLFCKNDTLFMIDKRTWNAEEEKQSGTPSIAAFDKYTGRRYSFNTLPKRFDKDLFGKDLTFVTDTLYEMDRFKQKVKPIMQEGNTLLLYGENGDILATDTLLNVVKTYPSNDVFSKWTDAKGGFVIGQEGENPEFYLVDGNFNVAKSLPKGCIDALMIGKRIFLNISGEIKIYNADTFGQDI